LETNEPELGFQADPSGRQSGRRQQVFYFLHKGPRLKWLLEVAICPIEQKVVV
jgi:hypothetical protein